MKKIVSIIAGMAMLCTFSTSVFAANPIDSVTAGSNSDSHDVLAKYNGGVSTPDVYSVNVEWGKMEFTYNVGGTKTWNADDHSYTDSSTASWIADGNTVVVTNHSNVDVTAKFAFAKGSTITDNITGSFDQTLATLNAGTVGAYATAANVTSTLTLSGTVSNSLADFTEVGSVTITIE